MAHGGSAQGLGALARSVGERYGARVEPYVVAALGAPPGGDVPLASALGDPELALHHRYGAESACLYLVRPDGYVGFRSQPAVGASLVDHLGRMFT